MKGITKISVKKMQEELVCENCDRNEYCSVGDMMKCYELYVIKASKPKQRGRAGAVLFVTLADGSPPLGGECLRLKG